MSETVPLTSINDNKPTQLNEQIHEIEDEGIPLVESNEGHGYTQLEWDLFWGFSVDYEFKSKELFHRMKYNIDTFKLNYIVLFTILFSISFLVKPTYGLVHLLMSLLFIIIFFNQKSPIVRFYLKVAPIVLLLFYFILYITFVVYSQSVGLIGVFVFSLLVCVGHMMLKANSLEFVDDMEFEF
ncbi:hypothetical protein ENUP19_0317G0009 [Entamoeba nuttalli]|uniref:PRA1 family protein n=1 Tax=Entamoeba nuttalli TaxID=412467 RepID=A0ABQ0DVX4_9EUKA